MDYVHTFSKTRHTDLRQSTKEEFFKPMSKNTFENFNFFVENTLQVNYQVSFLMLLFRQRTFNNRSQIQFGYGQGFLAILINTALSVRIFLFF